MLWTSSSWESKVMAELWMLDASQWNCWQCNNRRSSDNPDRRREVCEKKTKLKIRVHYGTHCGIAEICCWSGESELLTCSFREHSISCNWNKHSLTNSGESKGPRTTTTSGTFVVQFKYSQRQQHKRRSHNMCFNRVRNQERIDDHCYNNGNATV